MNRIGIADERSGDNPRDWLLQAEKADPAAAGLLAALLDSGQGDASALELSNRLLEEYKSIRGVLDAATSDLIQQPGVDAARVARLKAVLPLAGRYAECRLRENRTLAKSSDTAMFVIAEYQGLEREVFGCLFLDARNRLIRFQKMFWGSIDRAFVFPREIAKAALQCNAAGVVFAHNHPSGQADPSRADLELTHNLVKILGELDVRVLDHVIVGRDRTLSLAEMGHV